MKQVQVAFAACAVRHLEKSSLHFGFPLQAAFSIRGNGRRYGWPSCASAA